MSHRLQVLVPEHLDARLRKAAQRNRVSKGEWVRRAMEDALCRSGEGLQGVDPLDRLSSLGAPTAGIDGMIAEIETGRSRRRPPQSGARSPLSRPGPPPGH